MTDKFELEAVRVIFRRNLRTALNEIEDRGRTNGDALIQYADILEDVIEDLRAETGTGSFAIVARPR